VLNTSKKLRCLKVSVAVAVAGYVAAQTLISKEVGGNGFTFVAKEVASLRVKVAQLRCMAKQLRNYPKLTWS